MNNTDATLNPDIQLGSRVTKLGVIDQVDQEDTNLPYRVEWDNGYAEWCRPDEIQLAGAADLALRSELAAERERHEETKRLVEQQQRELDALRTMMADERQQSNSVNATSRTLLDEFIAKQDVNPHVPRAFSEADVIELGLRLLTIANKSPLNMPLGPVFNLSVAEFEIARQKK